MSKKIVIITRGCAPTQIMLDNLGQGASYLRVMNLATNCSCCDFEKAIRLAGKMSPDHIFVDRGLDVAASAAVCELESKGCRVTVVNLSVE